MGLKLNEYEPKNFSQIYGTKTQEIRNLITEGGQRTLTLAFLKSFPSAVSYFPGLRKLKAKAMINALIHGHYDNGNHFITCYQNDYHFYYRGTLIYKWNADTDAEQEVNAGEFEGTASTRNQRKEIRKAIENFRVAVLGV